VIRPNDVRCRHEPWREPDPLSVEKVDGAFVVTAMVTAMVTAIVTTLQAAKSPTGHREK
jgi:hypothetical protein